ncbi:hypothetical protein Ahy_A04g019266 [Arachis hypogaea]|uniref:Uncharacterized protein n=1 Tax=Arachis hypogaea TaxID=3818 RepID=A0A445DFM3_ARAHY|nr:hypothetical protein Ahy_A04g019266 [Arachis hypogaea]
MASIVLTRSLFCFRLLSPPDAPLFPTLEKEPHISVKSEAEIHKTRPTALKPRVSNIQVEPSSRTKSNIVTKNNVTMPGHGSSTTSNKKPSSSGPPSSASSRSSTPSRSVRSGGSLKSKAAGVSDSPLATSSTASSEPISCDGSEVEESNFGS